LEIAVILKATPVPLLAMPLSGPGSIAVIGAGVSGCALVAQLRRLGFGGSISLWETGRGPGGRASTRRSRHDAELRIDHGAPLLNITGETAPRLLQPLLEGGWIEPWQGAIAQLQGESTLRPGQADALGLGQLYRGLGGMDHLCRGLLSLAGNGCDTHYGTLVRHLSREAGPWHLLGRNQELLGQADWLVLSSTLLAHPRSRAIFGWEDVPLQVAAAPLGDLQLEHALTVIAGIRSEARSNLLVVLDSKAAGPWRNLPFSLLHFDAAAQQRWGLQRITIQPQQDGRCAVVAHSTQAFAADHLDVYGTHSAVARMLQLPPDEGREDTVIAALTTALEQVMATWLPGLDLGTADCQLMRWGAAFPLAPGLPSELMFCSRSRVGFCGDFIAGVGFGRIEGALRSGEQLALELCAAADRCV
jgi:predicted NAD/FAD-dependent oxidoreductase